MANFTPGPYITGAWTSQGRIISSVAGSKYLGYAQGYPNPNSNECTEEEANANAFLWAAATDLYEALELFSQQTPKPGQPLRVWLEYRQNKLRAALAKARGENRG